MLLGIRVCSYGAYSMLAEYRKSQVWLLCYLHALQCNSHTFACILEKHLSEVHLVVEAEQCYEVCMRMQTVPDLGLSYIAHFQMELLAANHLSVLVTTALCS